MKKLIICLSLLLLIGCSHSTDTVFSGNGLNFGYDPNTNKIGIQWFSGTIVNSFARENHELEVQYQDGLKNQATTNTSVDGKLIFKSKTGVQLNGYTVKLAQAGLKGQDIKNIYANGKSVNIQEKKVQQKQETKTDVK